MFTMILVSSALLDPCVKRVPSVAFLINTLSSYPICSFHLQNHTENSITKLQIDTEHHTYERCLVITAAGRRVAGFSPARG